MKEHENHLTPEAIDGQTERSSDELSQEENRLVQDIYSLSQTYAQENERSLEQIWSRFVQSQEHPIFLQERQYKEPVPGGKPFLMEGKAMQAKDISQEADFPILNKQIMQRPHRPLWHALSIGGAVAVVLLTILSWTLLSYGLRHRSQNQAAPGGQTTQTGTAQKGLSAGTLVCSFSDDNSGVTQPLQPSLDWSSQELIATTYASLKTFSAQNCTPKSANLLPLALQATWSPDGKRLLVLDGSSRADVLDANTGHIIASFSGGGVVDQSVWVANGTQVVSAVTKYNSKQSGTVSIQVWDASSGKLIRTALTFANGVRLLGQDVGQLPISSGGKYVAVQTSNNTIETWDIDSGKLIGRIPYNQSSVSALAWSPDGTFLAFGLLNASEVQVWTTATGRLLASFKDSDSSEKFIGALAWSPNGKYLAESGSDIHIWDVKAQKIVATFGKVDKAHWIATLSWSLQSDMLASSTNRIFVPGDPKSAMQNTVKVWKLS